jgi:DNA-binding beta-propeller fold protein YncE
MRRLASVRLLLVRAPMTNRHTALGMLALVVACSTGSTHNGQTVSSLSNAGGPPSTVPPAQGAFTAFETGQVRPLALSPSGKFLFATNTPDNRLEIFRVQERGLTHLASVPVGLEPIAVAARTDTEIWVVNHLSDSVSIVNVHPSGKSGRVVRTLFVGDEPRDIVFAGAGKARAFITTAHRGQNNPNDPQLTTPGIGRADVWVFDAGATGDPSLGGTPLTILTLFTDTPRALAATPDGKRVYAAGFHTGNQTTTLTDILIPDGDPDVGVPAPRFNHQGIPAPEVGIIVKFDGEHWRDSAGKIWDAQVRFNLPDKDVFMIDAMSDPPQAVAGAGGNFTGVGTILFNMVVNPANGKVYVSNLESRNDHSFEGAGVFTHGETLRGHATENRISVLNPSVATNRVAPRHLNKHIDYAHCCDPIPNAENDKSLALPVDMAITNDGGTLYVAAFGSSKVGVYESSELENDTFVPNIARQIEVSGGGPSGLALDQKRDRLYVMTRFDNGISVVDTKTRSEVGHVQLHNPEPASIQNGRRFLYDARFTSSHGDQACASCHIFGDFDSIAWNLGDPDLDVQNNPGPFRPDPLTTSFLPFKDYHPIKGPMTTQSLRGMANHGAMHWRGDRTGGNDAPSVQPDSGSFDEVAAFKKFNIAFQSILGRSEQLTEEEMAQFTEFMLRVSYPPNPIRHLDNSLTPDQAAGRDFFFGPVADPHGESCSGCHTLDPNANPSSIAPGFFGTDGRQTFEFQSQMIKVPHLRNMYQKVGRFGFPEHFLLPDIEHQHMGDQVRGYGYIHDGSLDTLFRFNSLIAFIFPPEPQGNVVRHQVDEFLLAFDSNLAPVVGQQVTLSNGTLASAPPRIDLLRSRAEAAECDLVAKMGGGRDEEGFFYVRNVHTFARDRHDAEALSDAALRQYALTRGQPLTYTCVPPGSGERIGIDRDGNGVLDGDEE